MGEAVDAAKAAVVQDVGAVLRTRGSTTQGSALSVGCRKMPVSIRATADLRASGSIHARRRRSREPHHCRRWRTSVSRVP